MMAYARKNPVKFAALSSFCTLGALPVLAFLAYSVATIVTSVVGAVVIELFLLAMGIMGLALVLFFVTCASVCATSVFAAVYFTYKATTSTFKKSKDMRFHMPVWPFSSAGACSEVQLDHHIPETDKKK
jgi:uncharacterized membrane protein